MARQFTWIPPAGGAPIVLSDESAGFRVKAGGTRGLWSPSYRRTTTTYAGLAGTTLEMVQADEREVSLGLQVSGETPAEFRARWRALIRAFRPMPGEGILQVADEYGVVRSLNCRYVGGLEGDAEAQFTGVQGRAVVALVANDPWFYGDAQTVEFGLGAPVSFFTPTAGFPLTLSSSTVQGMFEVDLSESDSPAYPQWTIIGPGSSLLLENQTTGRQIQVNASLASGEVMVIDTRPTFQSIRRGDGTNLLGFLSSDPALWPLIEGVNRVSAQLVGATSNSKILGAFRPRYAGI